MNKERPAGHKVLWTGVPDGDRVPMVSFGRLDHDCSKKRINRGYHYHN